MDADRSTQAATRSADAPRAKECPEGGAPRDPGRPAGAARPGKAERPRGGPPADISEDLRSGGRTLIEQGIVRSGVRAPGGTSGFAARIEAALYEGAPDREAYVRSYAGVSRALPKPFGEFLEGSLAEFVADGRLSLDDLCACEVADSYLDVTPGPEGTFGDPRRRMRGALYAALKSEPRLGEGGAQDFAARIERSCYNAAIERCVESERPVRRLWNDPEFVTVYNARVGVVLSNLDPESSVVRLHGSWAFEQLLAGEFSPDAVGGMEASELCPRASEEVRAEIRLRSQQKVVAKESRLFRCPACKARRHTVPGTGTQMAAGDEASTYMLSCLECGERFEGKG